jgi:DNA invertase Pin-like site-specific DNA recombinase
MTTATKSACYCRISTLIHGQSLENQLVPIREFAKARSFHLVKEYSDEGISGAKERRKGLDQMLSDAKRGLFKVLIVMEISRLARDVRHLLNLLFELDRIGVTVISIREGVEFSSVLGRAMVAMIGVLVSVERDLLRERIKSALNTKRLAAEQAGKRFNIGRPPVITPEIAKQIIDLRAQGHSIRRIAKLIESPVGKPIGKTTIERVLREYRRECNMSQNEKSPASNQALSKRKIGATTPSTITCLTDKGEDDSDEYPG